ncbi:hypothetical protein PO909_002661 [Leuciscus waleckii]
MSTAFHWPCTCTLLNDNKVESNRIESRDDIWRRTNTSPICKEEGIRFTEDLTQEDWRSRQALWPKIDQARKEGKAAGFRGPFGFIEGKRIMEAGVAICSNRCPGKILGEKADKEGYWVACVLEIDANLVILINIYGYNNDNKNRNLLHQISEVIIELKAKFPTDHIIVGGDFNLTPDEWMDRWPSKLLSEHRNPILDAFANQLIDIWRSLHSGVKQFTWHKPNGQNKSRIDYWLISNSISDHVTETEIANCPLSDHCIINLKIGNSKKITNQKIIGNLTLSY